MFPCQDCMTFQITRPAHSFQIVECIFSAVLNGDDVPAFKLVKQQLTVTTKALAFQTVAKFLLPYLHPHWRGDLLTPLDLFGMCLQLVKFPVYQTIDPFMIKPFIHSKSF